MSTLWALLSLPASAVDAEPPKILQKGQARAELAQKFGGTVKSATLRTALKAPSVIMTSKEMEAHWKAWKLGKVPKVDFETQVVTVATWSGSGMEMYRGIDDKGNLSVSCVGGTKDLVDGLTYAIEIYTISGIRTVNGKKLPTPNVK